MSAKYQVDNGILTQSSNSIQGLGKAEDVEILNEYTQDKILFVHIRARITEEGFCENGNNPRYKKSIAFAQFPLQRLRDAANGQLQDIQTFFATQLTEKLRNDIAILPYNVNRVDLFQSNISAPTRQLFDGRLTNSLEGTDSLHAQYIVAGVIRNMGMRKPKQARENNILVDWYNSADYAGSTHIRDFVLDLYIYDGFSGALMSTKHYETEGFWRRPAEEKTRFNSQLFTQQDYGQKVHAIQQQIIDDLKQEVRCEPLEARITRVQGQDVWISAGSSRGLKKGDTLKVLRKYTHYDDQLRAFAEFDETEATLRLTQVQPNFAHGRLEDPAGNNNIEREDLVRMQ